MAKALDVASYLLFMANTCEDKQITNLKLNKLMYFAQGTFLARTNKTLFATPIEVWDLGPVVSDVYKTYKFYGNSIITYPHDDFKQNLLNMEERDALIDVYMEFGHYSGAALVRLTHLPDTPWSIARKRGKKTIDNELLKEYFLQHPVPKLTDAINIPTVTAFPADWYDQAEDKIWEEYL